MKDAYSQILDDPRFQELVSKRNRFSWTLSALILIAYLAFIFLIAFAPQVLGTRISPDSVTTWGIPIGVGLILFAFILTGIYVRRANGEFDRLTKAILDEVQQ